MNAIDILRKQQAQNRSNFAERKVEVSPALYRSIGFDAETGMLIVSNGSDTVSAGRNTNGAIKPNQPVKTTQAGSRVVIDSMPSPKTRKSTTATRPGKVKVLFATYQGGIDSSDGTISLWVGGWRSNPVKIAEYPNNQSRFTNIISPSINNLGGDKWIAAWEFATVNRLNSQIVDQDWITRSNSGIWRFSETDLGKSLRSAIVDSSILLNPYWASIGNYYFTSQSYRLRHRGFGFWSLEVANGNVRTFAGSVTQNSHTGLLGYWLKDDIVTQPWSRFDTGSVSSGNSNSQIPIALFAERFETFNSSGSYAAGSQSVSQFEAGEIFLLNDRYNQSLGWKQRGSVSLGNSYLDPVSGYWRFGEDDQQLRSGNPFQSDAASSELQQLVANHANWIGQKLFVCNEIPQQFRSGSKVRVVAKEIVTDSEDLQLTRQVKSFKESVFPLKPRANILAVSYHPN